MLFFQERINRRMSTSFLQNLLVKQHVEKDSEAGGDSSRGSGSDRGSSSELSTAGMSLQASLAPSRESCTAVAQIAQYVHALVVSTLFFNQKLIFYNKYYKWSPWSTIRCFRKHRPSPPWSTSKTDLKLFESGQVFLKTPN